MTKTSCPPREIDGKGRTIRELLAGRKYSIDYYQREYKWPPAKSAPARAQTIRDRSLLWVARFSSATWRSSRTRASSPSTATMSAASCNCPRASTPATGTCRTPRSVEHYLSQNLLACSLHEQAYDHNPGFRRFIAESRLPFRTLAEFKKD